jgi:hypothetical protein
LEKNYIRSTGRVTAFAKPFPKVDASISFPVKALIALIGIPRRATVVVFSAPSILCPSRKGAHRGHFGFGGNEGMKRVLEVSTSNP